MLHKRVLLNKNLPRYFQKKKQLLNDEAVIKHTLSTNILKGLTAKALLKNLVLHEILLNNI